MTRCVTDCVYLWYPSSVAVLEHREGKPEEDDAPRMFRNVLRDVKRLAEDYDATPADIKWLQKELGKLVPKEAPSLESGPAGGKRRRGKVAGKDSNP